MHDNALDVGIIECASGRTSEISGFVRAVVTDVGEVPMQKINKHGRIRRLDENSIMACRGEDTHSPTLQVYVYADVQVLIKERFFLVSVL